MSNGYLTGCAFIIALLIIIMFFLKKTVNNIETKIFKKMLIVNVFESLTTTLIVIVALTINNTEVLKILNRIDVILIISWCSLMFYYIYTITNVNYDKRIKNYIYFLNVVIFVFCCFLPVDIIVQDGVLNSTGPLTYLGLTGATIYIIFMILTLIIYRKKVNKLDKNKYIPLYFLMIMLLLVAMLRLVVPEINFISIMISLVNMIMVFTIENPDVKLVEKLEIANKRVEKANNVKSEFISSMSHEIRTPLNAISGYSQLMDTADSLEEAKEYAKEVLNSSDILVKMVSNILDIFKIESNEINNTFEVYDPYIEFNDLLDLYEDRINLKNLVLKRKIKPNLPKLYGNINLIKEVLTYVIDNAIKYTDKGKIEFIVDTVIKNDKCDLKMKIEDTGKGIKKENLKNIFDYFERGENKDSSINGFGLGLPLSKKLLELIDGKIEVKSVYNKGTVVEILITEKIAQEVDK